MKSTVKKLVVGFTMFTLGMMVLSKGYAQVPQLINYQAVIKNQSNSQTVADGNYQITYRIYTTLTGGSTVWSEATTDTVASGVLNHVLGSVSTLNLPVNSNYYLTIQLNGDSEMSPREQLTSVGSALIAGGLSNGATWYGSVTGNNNSSSNTLTLNNTGNGDGLYSSASEYGVVGIGNDDTYGVGVYGEGYYSGIYGYGNGSGGAGVYGEGYYGVWGYGDEYGVYAEGDYGVWGYGYSDGVVGVSLENSGAGVYGYSDYTGGWGVYGYSAYTGGYGVEGDGYYGSIGVKGYSDRTVAVFGFTTSMSPSIYGENTVDGIGVEGYVAEGTGVYGVSNGRLGSGVYGSNTGVGYGVSGFTGYGIAVFGYSTASTGYAVYGVAQNGGTGVYAEGDNGGVGLFVENGGAIIYGNVTVNGNIYYTGTETHTVLIAQNVGTDSLVPGDMVSIQDSSQSVAAETPAISVSKSAKEYDTGFIGVVESYYSTSTASTNTTREIQKGDYLHLVTSGIFKSLKVDASYGVVHPGDLLTSSSNPGYAMKAQPVVISGRSIYPTESIIGKSLGTLESGQGSIPVFVGRQ
jgi:hypothetical protein